MKKLAVTAVASFLVLHGIAHLVGLTGDPGLGAPLWLVGAIAFPVSAYALVWRRPWFATALGATATYSLLLSAAYWPEARVGVFLNAAILTVLAGVALRRTAGTHARPPVTG